jgi:hypothetical protein
MLLKYRNNSNDNRNRNCETQEKQQSFLHFHIDYW